VTRRPFEWRDPPQSALEWEAPWTPEADALQGQPGKWGYLGEFLSEDLSHVVAGLRLAGCPDVELKFDRTMDGGLHVYARVPV
jgi:hypothetical protein